jgi:xylulokinase
MSAVLAVDIGTTNVKAAIFDEKAGRLALGSRRQEILSPQVGWREHDPAATWDAVGGAIASAVADASTAASEIRALAVTGPRGSAALLSTDGTPRTRILTWQDRRAADPPHLLANLPLERSAYYQVTGTPLDPSVVLARILWLNANDPACLSSADTVLATPQSYVLMRLGASKPVVDFSVAAHVGLFDVHRLEWSMQLVRLFGIPPTLLPPAAQPGTIVGELLPEVASRLGLPPGVPLVLAGSDGVCAELGAGVVEHGELYGYLGSASTVAGPLDQPCLDPTTGLIVMPGSRADRWRILALAMAGGSALDWFAEVLGHRVYGDLELLLQQSPPGARGVRFLPTLAGAGAPFWDSAARGAFLGLSLSTTPADLARAVLEGVALEMRWMVEAMHAFGQRSVALHLTGGGTRSDGWCQIVADATGLRVRRVPDPELGLRGAAFYALAALGQWASALDGARAMIVSGDDFLPNPQWETRYAEAADLYKLARQSFRETGIDRRLLMAGAE